MAKGIEDQTKGEEMLRQGAARQFSSLKKNVRGAARAAHTLHCPRASHTSHTARTAPRRAQPYCIAPYR